MHAWVFLSGPMGAGKSTLGRALAERLSARFADLDAHIERAQGRAISEIFAQHGEDAFRAIEAESLSEVLSEAPAVVALGGGTVVDTPTRRALLERGVLITLTAEPGVLRERIGAGDGRPLAAQLERLLLSRAGAYAECHAVVRTDGVREAVLEQLVEIARSRSVVVPLGERTYQVELGRLAALERVVDAIGPTSVVVVTDENVLEPWGARVAKMLDARVRVVLDAGEENKTVSAVERIWDAALDAEVDRDCLFVAVGGGVVGDLTGFAAATLMRGVAFVQVPTTTLAMVDASVGGKTGFDRPQGKNLAGAFHQPERVLIDIDTLSTLPDEELRSGFAEVVKSAWLDSEEAVAALERDAEALCGRDADALLAAVQRSVTLKARVVALDETEGGHRRLLNLGHTVGHAIEAARGYRGIRHGEAVSLGLIAAFRVAAQLGDARASRHEARARALLERLGLPVDVDAWWDAGAAAFIGADKKRRGDQVRFVVPGAPGEARVVALPLAHEFGLGRIAPVE